MDNSILYDFNNYIYNLLGIPAMYWGAFEMLISVPIFFLCIWQRLHTITTRSSSKKVNYIGVLMGQLSLYIHMVLALLCFVDGFQSYIKYVNFPHATIIVAMFSLLIRKIGLFLTYERLIAERY